MRFDHCLICSVLLKWVAIGVVVFGGSALTVAQPVQSEIADLQKRLAELQAHVHRESNTTSPFQTGESADSNRVRSVGVQPRHDPTPLPPVNPSTLKLYDLSDIFSISPQYPAVMDGPITSGWSVTGPAFVDSSSGGGGLGGGMGGMGGGMGGGGAFSIPSVSLPRQSEKNLSLRQAQVSISELVEAIKTTIEPEEWDSAGGEESITVLGNSLLVTAKSSQHEKISNLLNLFREQWGSRKTVSVQLFWIRATADSASELLTDEVQSKDGAGVVADDTWTKFFQAATDDQRLAYTTTLVGHNGQTLSTWSGQDELRVVDASPVITSQISTELDGIAAEQVVGITPQRRNFFAGTVSQVTPLATRGGNYVILDVHSRLQRLAPSDQPRLNESITIQQADGKIATLQLDPVDIGSWNLNATVRCPNNRIVLVGSATGEHSTDAAPQNMLLFARVAVHQVQEDDSDRKVVQ